MLEQGDCGDSNNTKIVPIQPRLAELPPSQARFSHSRGETVGRSIEPQLNAPTVDHGLEMLIEQSE